MRVHHDGGAEPLILRVRGRYIPPIHYTTSRIDILIAKPSSPFRGEREVFVNAARGVRVTGVTWEGPPARAAVAAPVPADDGFSKVVVSIEGLHDGGPLPQRGDLTVTTDSPDLPAVQLDVVLRKPSVDDITASPSRVGFGILAKTDRRRREVVLRMPKAGQFDLVQVVSTHPALVCTTEPVSRMGGEDTLRIYCDFEAARATGAIDANIDIHLTGESGEHIVSVPASAFVRP